jgi:hypothetical protein
MLKRTVFVLTFLAFYGFINQFGQVNAQHQRRTLPYRFLIPEGYVGWIRIDFNVAGAPELPMEDGYYVFRFPESGRLQTSSDDIVESRRNQFFYYGSGKEYLLETSCSHGACMVQEEFSGPGSSHPDPIPNHYRYVFIGPLDAFEKRRLKEGSSSYLEGDGYPKVGAHSWLTQDDLVRMRVWQP